MAGASTGSARSWVDAHRAGARRTSLFYVKFATAPWMFALLPLHFVMGPIHGAIVNWCGHRYGYRNFDNGDDSRNTLVVRLPHARASSSRTTTTSSAMSPNFAVRWFEIDPTYQVIRVLAALGIVKIATTQKMRWPAEPAMPEGDPAE